MKQPSPPAKKSPGRPRIVEGGASVTLNIRLSVEQRDKLTRLGGAPWIREKIAKAK